MIGRIKYLIQSKTSKDLGIVLVENIISKIIRLILIVLVARVLGPEKYGIYSLITVSILFLSLFFDFGLENPAVRFSVKLPDERDKIFGFYTLFKSIILTIFVLLLLIYPRFIEVLLNKSDIRKYLIIICLGCLIESYQYIITTYFQSLEKFSTRAAINVGVDFLRLLLILILFKLDQFKVIYISYVFAIAGIPVLIIYTKKIFRFIQSISIDVHTKKLLKNILDYSQWLVLGALAMNLMTRLDFYFVTSTLGFSEAGLYNSAIQLVAPLMIIRMVVGKVFLPKISKLSNLDQIKKYISKVIKVGVIIILFIAIIFIFAKFIILIVFGNQYLNSLWVYRILLISYLITLFNVLLTLVFYSLGYSKYVALGAYVQVFFFIIFSLYLIPKWGMEGAALSRLIATISSLGVTIFFIKNKIYKSDTKILAI